MLEHKLLLLVSVADAESLDALLYLPTVKRVLDSK